MHSNRLKPMTEGGLLIAIALMFSLFGAYIPAISIFTDLLWPAPIVLLCVRHGYKWSVLATIVSAILLAILLHPLQAVMTILSLGLMANVLGVSFRKSYAPTKTLLFTTIATFISLALVFIIGFWITGLDPIEAQRNMFSQLTDQMVIMYQDMGMTETSIEQFKTQFATAQALLSVIFPVLFLIAALFSAWLNFTITRNILNRLGNKFAGLPSFYEWQASRSVVWCLALAMIMLIFAEKNDLVMTKNIGMNLQMLAGAMLFVCGLSLLSNILRKYRIPKIFQFTICVFVIVNSFLSQVAIIAAIADVAFDFRKLRQSQQHLDK